MGWYFEVLSKYAAFTGRARRKEYWAFFGWNLLISFMFGIAESATQPSYASGPSGVTVLANLYQLAILLPAIAVAVRRMHDTNHSGWWAIVPLANFVLALQEGDRGDNRFGPDPKVVATPETAGVPVPQIAE
jgi:uncharacterized membrane protein YhaH (DUF805 family)